MISASGRAMATRLIQIATGDESASVEGWTSRAGLEDPRKVAVQKWCAENTVDHVVSTLLAAEIPAAPVKTIPQAAEDPHLWEREMLVKMPDAWPAKSTCRARTIKMSKTPGRVGHVPTPGEHTDEILSGLLGYNAAMLRELREAKVIGENKTLSLVAEGRGPARRARRVRVFRAAGALTRLGSTHPLPKREGVVRGLPGRHHHGHLAAFHAGHLLDLGDAVEVALDPQSRRSCRGPGAPIRGRESAWSP